MFFDGSKDAVSGESLVFGNLLRFPGVNWAQKTGQNCKLWVRQFPFKHIVLNDSSNTVFAL